MFANIICNIVVPQKFSEYLSIVESELLKSQIIILLLFTTPFSCVSNCFKYLNYPMLGEENFIIVIYSWWIHTFTIIWWLSLFLLTIFSLKSIFSNVSIANSTFFWLTVFWKIFFYSSNLDLCVLKAKASFL